MLTDEKEQDEFFKRIREKNDIEPVIRSHPTFQKNATRKLNFLMNILSNDVTECQRGRP